MKRFLITPDFQAECTVAGNAFFGTLLHVQRNAQGGGARLTPVARYFAGQPEFVEGYHKYWRVDCFFGTHQLSPEPMSAGTALVEALKKEGLCSEPVWLSVHRSEELEGKAFGKVFEDDRPED